MSDAQALARQLGVDEETVASILQFARKGDAAEGPGQLDGIASCLNQACDRFNEDRPIRLVVDHVSRTYKDQGGDLAFEATSTDYTHPVNDEDLLCPGCGEPCAKLPGKRPRVPAGFTR